MTDPTTAAPPPPSRRPIPSSASVVGLLAIVAILPFLLVDLPSMTDLPGHIGRYHVMLAREHSVWLQRYYAFDWHLVGNLGVDLLVRALGPVLGVEHAARIAVALTVLLTIAGIAAVSRTAHGRVQPGAVVACCFVLSNPLMFGFVNYCLSWALALLAFAAWIALRRRAAAVQLAATTPLVLLVWLAHAMGWGVLALLVAGFEGERLWRRRAALVPAAVDTAIRLLAFLPPLVLTLAWRGGGGGALYGYGTEVLARKFMDWVVLLRGEAPWIDIGTPILLGAALLLYLVRRWLAIDWRVASGGVLLVLATLALPATLFGSWAADERIAPAAVTVLALSLGWRGPRRAALALVLLAATLITVRTALIVRDWRTLDADYRSNLRALDHVPTGARLHALVLTDACHAGWRTSAYAHLPSIAIVRRDALENSQWPLQGTALLRVVYPVPADLRNDPSQQIATFDCAGRADLAALHDRLARLDPDQWDYAWMLGTRGVRPLWPGHRPVYADADSALYRLP